jgi:hypothetical protein
LAPARLVLSIFSNIKRTLKSSPVKSFRIRFCSLLALAASFCDVRAQVSDHPHPVKNTQSAVMLSGDWIPGHPHKIDFANLPKVPGQHVVISDVNQEKGVNQHNYLVHFKGKFWAMWSEGPGIEDRVGQRVKYATSLDGLKWTTPKFLSPEPPGSGPGSAFYGTRTDKGFRYIARGFWVRNNELLALASLDEADGFFGKSLELRAFRLNKKNESWEDIGVVFDNTINNFAPEKLPTGQWMMSRRTYDYTTAGVHFIIGGKKSLTDWTSFPVLGTSEELSAEEPNWWLLPDNNAMALFRDNKSSGYIYRSFSSDDGRTWSKPVKTDFPDARSKFSGLRLADGRYVLVSNPNPLKRDPLTISISNDGMVFDKMFYLVGGRHIDYPHVIEHKGYLLVAFAGGKRSVEVIKIKLSDLNKMEMPVKK